MLLHPVSLAVQKTVPMILLSVVLGPLFLASIVAAKPIVHRPLANAPRKRKHHIRQNPQDLRMGRVSCPWRQRIRRINLGQ